MAPTNYKSWCKIKILPKAVIPLTFLHFAKQENLKILGFDNVFKPNPTYDKDRSFPISSGRNNLQQVTLSFP